MWKNRGCYSKIQVNNKGKGIKMEYQDFYYQGFEGEPEIIFKKEDNDEILVIWEGYFDQIMCAIEPSPIGWTGAAYYYNMHLGWYEESPWEIKDLCGMLAQFKSIKRDRLPTIAAEILEILCDKIANAINKEFRIFIAKE